jgi:hypothetical protein
MSYLKQIKQSKAIFTSQACTKAFAMPSIGQVDLLFLLAVLFPLHLSVS